MEGFCRACLIKYEDPLDLLQYTETNRRLFVYCTGIQVKRNDTFTFQLCKECYSNMKIASKFKKLCRTSDKRFKNFMTLKSLGEAMDFPTFLKNSEDSLTLRLPIMSGSSTPANQKYRDDDNESTCTSIRNFMTDILQGEEVPVTEPRIVRELIEEEADVLEDSLDSHWLQDDVSVDTDFRLNFSFSPFSTPKSVNNDVTFTPSKFTADKESNIQRYSPNVNREPNRHVYTNITESIYSPIYKQNYEPLENGEGKQNGDVVENIEKINEDEIYDKSNEPFVQNFYVEIEPMDASFEIKEKTEKENKHCVIDKNLEAALKDEQNENFALDDILVTPPVYRDVSAASTPTINNILFGKKLNSLLVGENPNIGQCIEKYEPVSGDISVVEEFLQNNAKDLLVDEKTDHDTNDIDNVVSRDDDNVSLINMLADVDSVFDLPDEKFDLLDNLCKLCNRKFGTTRALQLHFAKHHSQRIIIKKEKENKRYLCATCGKEFRNRFALSRHSKCHKKPKKEPEIHKCDICSLECTSKSKLEFHIAKVHDKHYTIKDTGKKFVCTVCGVVLNVQANFRLHMRRHAKEYSMECDHCGKGFYRKIDLEVHLRTHTGERPFACKLCPRRFARRDVLAKHIRWHTAEQLFECQYCDASYDTKRKLKHHMLKSKKCLKVRARLANDKDKTSVDIEYHTGANDIIAMQLPLIDTELSN